IKARVVANFKSLLIAVAIFFEGAVIGIVSTITSLVFRLVAKFASGLVGQVNGARLVTVGIAGAITAHDGPYLVLGLGILCIDRNRRERNRHKRNSKEKGQSKFQIFHSSAFLPIVLVRNRLR